MTMDDCDTVPTLDDAYVAAMRFAGHAPVTGVAEWGAATSRGLLRRQNEDAWGHLADQLFVVADGMGGYAGGQLAASTAVTGLLSTAASRGISDWKATFARLDNQVRTAARARGFERAGTALAAVTLIDGVMTAVNVGDVRVYLIRGHRLKQLTRDHNVRSELVAAGIGTHGRRPAVLHALTRYLGGATPAAELDPEAPQSCLPDAYSLVPIHGDRLVLATDGVHRQVRPDRLVEVVNDLACPDAATQIVALADQAGGTDNATTVVLELTSVVA